MFHIFFKCFLLFDGMKFKELTWKEIFKLFRKPDVKDEDLEFGEVDEDKIKKILVEEHDFSEQRVEKQLERLRKIKEKAKQKGLDKWV